MGGRLVTRALHAQEKIVPVKGSTFGQSMHMHFDLNYVIVGGRLVTRAHVHEKVVLVKIS